MVFFKKYSKSFILTKFSPMLGLGGMEKNYFKIFTIHFHHYSIFGENWPKKLIFFGKTTKSIVKIL